MTYVTTLKSCLEYVGTIFPTSVFEATLHAVALGAVEARRGEVRSWHVVQELTACQPELLDWPATVAVYDRKQEQEGMIFLEGDTSALFLFRIPLEVASHQGGQPCIPDVTFVLSGGDEH
jgi:hypothetical protein